MFLVKKLWYICLKFFLILMYNKIINEVIKSSLDVEWLEIFNSQTMKKSLKIFQMKSWPSRPKSPVFLLLIDHISLNFSIFSKLPIARAIMARKILKTGVNTVTISHTMESKLSNKLQLSTIAFRKIQNRLSMFFFSLWYYG